jgi:uncharacterized glyoxalase superfamily protein PhnB
MTTFHKIEPYLFYPDGRAALDWLQGTFGWGETFTVEEDGQVTEGSVTVGDSFVHVSGGGTPGNDNGGGVLNIITVDDVDWLYGHIRSTGVELDPPKDEPYGPRSINVTDPWGYRWYFWQGHAVY